ncbi:MAG: hypothetical protein LC734_03945, partial [Acidobacteria bacterium]|nr:hypothetical protein [Acidobacteriota bacterium]
MKFPQFSFSRINAASRSFKLLVLFLCLAAMATQLFAQRASRKNIDAANASVTPTVVYGNLTCAECGYAGELKIERDRERDRYAGTYSFSDGGNLTISNTQPTSGEEKSFDFTSTREVGAVLVKAGSEEQNLFTYNNGTFGDKDLFTFERNHGISHISFCYSPNVALVTIVKLVTIPFTTPPTYSSGQAFSFSTSFGANFSLTDSNADQNLGGSISFLIAAGQDRSFTEDGEFGWDLTDIECTITSGTGTESESVPLRTATVNLNAGASATCTFRNSQLAPSAAPASVSGRVTTADGV